MKAEIFEHSGWLLCEDDNKFIARIATGIGQSGHTVLRFIEHKFTPQGTTALWLLAESHLAVHTWPEEQKAYVQLSSCNAEKFAKFMEWAEAQTDLVIKD